MEKKDTILVLLVVGAGAYAAYANWDKIREKLSLDELNPKSVKAIKLAKDAFTFGPPNANWVVLRDRASNREITLDKEPWHAVEVHDPRYRVTCTWREGGQQQVHVFTVDIGSSTVSYEGLDDTRPAPR